MKKLSTLFLFCIFLQYVSAQSKTNYFISFKDKKDSKYSISNPEMFLTQKAIDRRTRQHIEIKESDLPVNANYISTIKNLGCKVLSVSRWFNAISITNLDATKVLDIKQLPFVKEIQTIEIPENPIGSSKFENEINTNIQLPLPTEKKSTEKATGLNYGLSFGQAAQINITCMHALGFQGQGMTIAMLDAGYYNANILPAFDSVRLSGRILGCRDFVTGDTLVYEDYSHGMSTLSCIVGNLPGRIIGTAPQAKVWLLRTEDVASETLQEEINWLVGAEFADSVGADVINSSLGYSLFDGGIGNHSYSDMDGNTTIITKAADWAASVGIFVCSSAGNAAGPPWYKITAPADADSILTVGAVDSIAIVASFSSRGYSFDGRIKPNTAARGVSAIVGDVGGDVIPANGTSFSSPITAGAVACLWQAHPTKTNMEILAAIEQSASQYASPDSLIGYGIPNFCYANSLMVGINEQHTVEESLTVFPNPFNANFDIQFYSNNNQSAKIEIVDISGRIVFSNEEQLFASTNNTIKGINLGKIANGLYVLKLSTPSTSFYKKIIKN